MGWVVTLKLNWPSITNSSSFSSASCFSIYSRIGKKQLLHVASYIASLKAQQCPPFAKIFTIQRERLTTLFLTQSPFNTVCFGSSPILKDWLWTTHTQSKVSEGEVWFQDAVVADVVCHQNRRGLGCSHQNAVLDDGVLLEVYYNGIWMPRQPEVNHLSAPG